MCLQIVMNYFDKVGVHNTTDKDVRKAYQNKFMLQACPYILKKFQKYKANHLLNIPHCMIHGSLKNALTINRGGKVFTYIDKLGY